MYRYNADKTSRRPVVVTNLELFFITSVFTSLLILFYPGHRIEALVLSETKNYDLTVMYLQNMLRQNPKNTTLLLALCRSGIAAKRYELVEQILKKLVQEKNPSIRHEALRLQFELYKRLYHESKDALQKKRYKKILITLLHSIAKKGDFDHARIDYWYRQAIAFHDLGAALDFIKPIIEKPAHPGQLVWLRTCYYIASQIGDKTMRNKCLIRLSELDKSGQDQWKKALFFILLDEKKDDEALRFLQKMAKASDKWMAELAAFYAQHNQPKKAAKIYRQLFEDAKDPIKQRTYFLKALQMYQYSRDLSEAIPFVRKEESRFIDDSEVAKKILAFYLATNSLDDATRFSKKILQRLQHKASIPAKASSSKARQ